MDKNNQFVKDRILEGNVETEEIDGKLHIVGIALVDVVMKPGVVFLYTSVKTISLLLILGSLKSLYKTTVLTIKSSKYLYDCLADNFDKTDKIVDDPKDREFVKNLIKSNNIGLAQTLIKNYKNIKNVK